MGAIFSASCDCGYTKDEIYVGGGMNNFKTYSPFPHYCPECKILFEGNLHAEETICCPECSTDGVISYYDEEICKYDNDISRSYSNRGFVLENSTCLCPACGKFSLSFDSHITYD